MFIAVLIIGWFIVTGAEGDRQQEPRESIPPSASAQPAPITTASPSSDSVRRVPTLPDRLDVVDILTEEITHLPGGYLQWEGERVALAGGSISQPGLIQRIVGAEPWLEYRASWLPSSRPIRRALEPLVAPNAAGLIARVPYRSILRLTLCEKHSGKVIPGTVRAALLDEGAWRATLSEGGVPGVSLFRAGSLQDRLQRYERLMGRLDWVSSHSDSTEPQSLVLPGSGPILWAVNSPGYKPLLVESSTLEGVIREEWAILTSRPRVLGTVLKSDGSPAVGADVIVKVLLSDLEPDFFQSDLELYSAVAVTEKGTESRVLGIQFHTDELGQFSGPITFGDLLAVQATLGQEFRFSEIGAIPSDGSDIKVTLRLSNPENPNEGDGLTLALITDQGKPIAHARVVYAIVDDHPWYRTFSPGVTDAEGRIRLHGVGIGETITLLVAGEAIAGERVHTLSLAANHHTVTL